MFILLEINILNTYLHSLWQILLESGSWLLLGFAIAGVLHLLLTPERLLRYLKGNTLRSIFSAVAIGTPIPLCSCSVLPVARTLRNAGAGKGPTAGFLVSSPETSIDAILLTWGLLGPVWAIARPVAAILSAFAAALLQTDDPPQKPKRTLIIMEESSCSDECSCCATQSDTKEQPSKLRSILQFAFIDTPTDLARYLVPGILLAALISAIFPPSSLAAFAGSWQAYAMAVLIGLPLYVCSTASTPLAASLLLSGVAPGAVLTFLLVGPATNVSAFAATRAMLGTAGFVRMLIAVTIVALACGISLDYLLLHNPAWVQTPLSMSGDHCASWWEQTGAAILVALLLYGLFRDWIQKKR